MRFFGARVPDPKDWLACGKRFIKLPGRGGCGGGIVRYDV